MNILFRTDASVHIGSGHVMRCLTLAQQLREKGHGVLFVCREVEGHLGEVIRARGYEVAYLPADITEQEKDAQETIWAMQQLEHGCDWVVVDHYGLDAIWEDKIRMYVPHICVIDDIANRLHRCEILLDQNLFPNMERRYDELVPKTCTRFIGPKYAILREEFYKVRKQVKIRSGEIKRILIFFGGSDETNETMKALRAVTSTSNRFVVDVIVGASNPHRNELQEFCASLSDVHFHCQIDYMARLMAEADLSIGGGGSTIWERCFLGLPSFTMPIAENQMATTAAVAAYGATWDIGWYEEVDSKGIAYLLRQMVDKPEIGRRMSEKGFALMGNDIHRFHPVLQTMEKMSGIDRR